MFAASQSKLTGDAIHDLWTRARPGLLVAALASMSSGLVFLALRWRALMPRTARVEILPLTGIFTIGTLLNYALPGPVGEVVAAAMAGRRFGMPAETALAAGIHARFIGLGVAGLAAGTLYLSTDLPVSPEVRRWVGVATAVIAVGAVCLGALSAWPAGLRWVSRATVGRVPFLAALHASVLRFTDALDAMGRHGARPWLTAALWAAVGHGCVIGGIWLAARGLGASPAAGGVAFTYAMATAGAVVLFAFPGSQVGWDAMFASLLVVTAGLPVADALALTVLVRAQQIGVVLVGAAVLLRHVAVHGDEGVPPAH